MKHVQESLSQYYDYKFFRVFEEDEKADLQDKEKDGLAVIEKLKKNFDEFKKSSKGEILKYKEFWEENQKAKEAFDEGGDIYKMFDSNYVVGVMELPVETLSDGSIDGGMGATDEPEEEIIEGPEIDSSEESSEEPAEDFFEEQQVPNPTNEAEGEEEDLDLDLNLDDEPAEGEEDLDLDISEPTGGEEPEGGEEVDLSLDEPADDMGGEEVDLDMEAPAEEPVDTTPDMNAPQKYFVVYDISGDEREEIFRCGSNNVVRDFEAFYNDTFKGSMKDAIIKHKEKKMAEKKEAEKAEKDKAETQKQSKIKKFLGESQRNYLNAVHAISKLNEAEGFQTLTEEMDEKEIAPEMKDFEDEDENTLSWTGYLIHPMTGYGGSFDYLSLTVTLTKEGEGKYVVTQEGERRNGSFSRYEQRQMDEGELEIDEYNIDDFDYDVDHEINDHDEFATLEEAIEFIDSESCLDFQG